MGLLVRGVCKKAFVASSARMSRRVKHGMAIRAARYDFCNSEWGSSKCALNSLQVRKDALCAGCGRSRCLWGSSGFSHDWSRETASLCATVEAVSLDLKCNAVNSVFLTYSAAMLRFCIIAIYHAAL